MITYNQLLQFVTVVQNQSISRAAEKLFIAQPAVSASVKKMETELNVQLFHYENKRLHLTEDGKKIYEIASDILFSYAKLENYTRYVGYGETTPVHYYASPALHDLLTPHLNLLNDFPKMRFIFHSCGNYQDFQDFLAYIKQDENCFGLFFLPESELSYLTAFDHLSLQSIATFPTLLITSANSKHPLCSKKSLSTQDLQDISFIDYTCNLCHPISTTQELHDSLSAPNTTLINSYLTTYPDTFIVGCLPFAFLAQEPLKRIPIHDAPTIHLVLIYANTSDDTFYTLFFSLVHSLCLT